MIRCSIVEKERKATTNLPIQIAYVVVVCTLFRFFFGLRLNNESVAKNGPGDGKTMGK